MSVNYESTVFGEVRAAGIHGRSGVGLSELAFSLVWSLHPKRDNVMTAFGTSIWVSARPDGEPQDVLLGQATPEVAWCNETREHPYEEPLLYRLLLPHPQLLALEHLRQGRGLHFSLDVCGNSDGPYGIRKINDTLSLSLNPSDWVRILGEAGVADVLMVGIHLPGAELAANYRSAIDLIRKANRHLIQGDYSVAVAESRRAIESLWKTTDLGAKATDARKKLINAAERARMSKREKELALGDALKHFCNDAHHVGSDAVPENFGRLDAALAVGATAALISSFVGSPNLMNDASQEDKASSAATPVAAPKPIAAPKVVSKIAVDNLESRVAKAVAHFKKNSKNRPGSVKTLITSLHSLFAKKLQPVDIDALVDELKRKKIISEIGKKLTYSGV